jgi:hypothetical protein
MNHATQHRPWSADLSAADQAAEAFRARVGTSQRLPEVPAEWAAHFTPQEWSAFTHTRFGCWHSEGAIITPEWYLANR